MSSFTSPLSVSPMPDGKRWKLTRPFTYRIGSKYSKRFVRVPIRFRTDFASIPKILRFLLFWWLPFWAKYSKAPVLHDWLYQKHQIMGKTITRKEADDIFLEAMKLEWRLRKSRYFLAHLEYWAVRLFARFAWKQVI